MKKLIFSFFVLLNTIVCFSQNYFPSKSNSILLFNSYNNTNYYGFDAVKWDSVKPSGQDTIYYSIPFVIDTSGVYGSGICVDTAAGSILGRVMIKTDENHCKIVNFQNDTILILPESAIGEQWKFFEFHDQSYLSAKTDSINLLAFCGISDSAKYITLLTKNYSGNDISGIFNNKQLVLSKNYGIIQSFNFFKFPSKDTAIYSVKGSVNPNFGIHDIAYKDVYNYNTGDEFHYLDEETNWLYNITDQNWHIDNGIITQTIRYVVNRTNFPIGDSVKYEFHDCKRIVEYFSAIPDTSYVQDTISQTVEFGKLNNFDFNHLPNEYIGKYNGIHDSVYFYRLSTILSGNKLVKSVTYDELMKTDSCWAYFMVDPGPAPYDFIEGCGGPYHYFADWMGYVKQNKLVYFNKNGDTWGTPVANDCEDLFSGISDYSNSKKYFNIFPNPASDKLTIVSQDLPVNEKLTFILFDLSGNKVFESLLSLKANTIDCRNIVSGTYFYKVIQKSNIQCGKLIILH